MLIPSLSDNKNLVFIKEKPDRIVLLEPSVIELKDGFQIDNMIFEKYQNYVGNYFFDTLFTDQNEVIGVRLRDDLQGVLSIPNLKDIDSNRIIFTEDSTSIFFSSNKNINELLSDQLNFFIDVYLCKSNGLYALIYPDVVLVPSQ